jgi:hypothetical protein
MEALTCYRPKSIVPGRFRGSALTHLCTCVSFSCLALTSLADLPAQDAHRSTQARHLSITESTLITHPGTGKAKPE